MSTTAPTEEKGIARSFQDLSREEFLTVVKALVTDPELLTRYEAPRDAPYRAEHRLQVGATCFNDRPFVIRMEAPGICSYDGPLGELATMELLRLNRCRIVINDLDYHSMVHLHDTVKHVVSISRAMVKNIEVRFLFSKASLTSDMLMAWFIIFREYAEYLSGKVSFDHERARDCENRDIIFDVMADEEAERCLIRRIAKTAKDLHAQYGPPRDAEDIWREENWDSLVYSLICRGHSSFPDHDRVKELHSRPH
ncbi:hypothetical protein BDZ85DRAFT_299085 [Elsinoe ampelina]|uniref:Uncharacterized protein n=1 Tax=Elsinoe ampelina TaxID=302913 RepID=A0A6A6G109_9PEZI|nr:hypothetical protein BDZ85DRAFT_299085 [Elsinoe ampelina]